MKATRTEGFSLLEVVAAIALLSILAIAVLPLLVDATSVIARPPAVLELSQLGEVADALVQDEELVARLQESGEASVPWPDDPDRPAITLRRFVGTGILRAPHEWVELRCGDLWVLRYLQRELQKDQSDHAGDPQ